MGKKTSGVRERYPVVNGIFYPDSPEHIIASLASWGLKQNPGSYCSANAAGGKVLIVPHGGWELTGEIAGTAFAGIAPLCKVPLREAPHHDALLCRASSRGISRVIVLGPQHSPGEEGIYLSESASFKTPLGDLFVDQKFNRKMALYSSSITINDIPHLSEHCLEVLLPIIKYCLGGVKIVPVIMNGEKPALISCLAKALALILESHMEESLVVVSSNVSRNKDPALALSMAEEFRSLLLKMNTKTFRARYAQGSISACGGAIVAALLESGLLKGRKFSALTPLSSGVGEEGDTLYYGAFECDTESSA